MKRVLIVEDNEMTLEIYKLIFEKYIPDVKVECIQDAEEGIERVTKNGFDLLIADYNLGHKTITGMDIARLAYPLGKPILIVSGHKITPKLSLIFRYWDMFNKVNFLGKPFRCKKLIAAVNKQLEKEPVPLSEMFQKITHLW
jgi:CheY-like chemotaxis protein